MADEPRPYRTYRSTPRGLGARVRGETDPEVGRRIEELERRPLAGLAGPARGNGAPRTPGEGPAGPGGPRRRFGPRRVTPLRVIKWVVLAAVAWLVLSFALFFISAETNVGSLPANASSQLAGGSTLLFSPETILILGLDTRPKTGPGSKEPGSNYNDKNANTDSIMLWRIGGGTSRRLSIPRDTYVDVPGYGHERINAAWSEGGPALTIRTVKALTGISTINHLIVVNLGNFPKFIDDIGGVSVKTGRVCSEISGGTAKGGFTLNLSPGTHHLDGIQALVYARTRENRCNAAYNDLNREAAQQQILNSIKSQLLTPYTFFHLPWAAWDAPKTIETDMGAPTLMQLFAAAEIGGSAKPMLLKESGEVTPGGADVLVPDPANVRAQVSRLLGG